MEGDDEKKQAELETTIVLLLPTLSRTRRRTVRNILISKFPCVSQALNTKKNLRQFPYLTCYC